jgi:2-methylisocitrate lyase-like PEP mutase family enzyme
MTTMSKLDTFAKLHQPYAPLILFNVWDAGSARAVAAAGAQAIATGSYAVAGAQGFGDGEKLPLAQAIAVASMIVSATELPVTVDLETGYGDVARSCRAIADVGAIGINLEDRSSDGAGLVSTEDQCERIATAVETGLFVNARTDLFIQTSLAEHTEALVEKAVERARAYAEAGARSLFAPFLIDPKLIGLLCSSSPLPVNIMVRPGCATNSELAALGVARISYGPGPWLAAMASLQEQARAVLS